MNIAGVDYDTARAPVSTSRLIPSRYPPATLLDEALTAADRDAAFELAGWTNDRLVRTRIARLPESQQVYGRPNASIVMAAFLHGSVGGLRFSDGMLGAWYASSEVRTALLEVANGLRKEISLSAITAKAETYREYAARLSGAFVDVMGRHPEFHDPDDATYPAPQACGESVRDHVPADGITGIRYESVRNPGAENWVCYHPPAVEDVVQARHFRVEVPATGKVVVRTLA